MYFYVLKKRLMIDENVVETLFRVPIPAKLLAKLKPGIHLRFNDGRGKQRILVVERLAAEQQWLGGCAAFR